MREKRNTDGHRSRLRKRFETAGIKGLADYEIVELLLTLCIPRKDVKQPAKALVEKFGNLRNILNTPHKEIASIPGIGSVAPTAFKIIRETAELYLLQSAENLPVLNNSDRLEKFWMSRLSHLTNEVFEIGCLDNRYRLIKNGVQRLEEGTIDYTIVYPRKVMEYALKSAASAIVLAHNHPSGAAKPSDHDIKLTQSLINAATTLNIEIVDHLIIAGKEIFSFRRNGLIKNLSH